jgi:hypothetical protein
MLTGARTRPQYGKRLCFTAVNSGLSTTEHRFFPELTVTHLGTAMTALFDSRAPALV